MASGGGGAWKVAYADFVTAMMAFFMVMWLTAQKPEVKQAVAGYFRDPYAIFKGNETGSAVDGAPTVEPKLGHDQPAQRRHVPNSGNEANYQFAVLFAADASELDASSREKIRSFAPTMVGKLNRVEIRAHCQRMPLPSGSPFKDGWELCFARGRAVMEELELNGVEAERMRVSLAESNEPLATHLSQDELALNSRVDIILLTDLIETPWREEGAGWSDGNHGAPHGGETLAPAATGEAGAGAAQNAPHGEDAGADAHGDAHSSGQAAAEPPGVHADQPAAGTQDDHAGAAPTLDHEFHDAASEH
jgi:chemotaxis protein MotB